jgi:hypothetical protein
VNAPSILHCVQLRGPKVTSPYKRNAFILGLTIYSCRRELPKIVHALGAEFLEFGGGQRRQQRCREDGEAGQHHQQFGQREAIFFRLVAFTFLGRFLKQASASGSN